MEKPETWSEKPEVVGSFSGRKKKSLLCAGHTADVISDQFARMSVQFARILISVRDYGFDDDLTCGSHR